MEVSIKNVLKIYLLVVSSSFSSSIFFTCFISAGAMKVVCSRGYIKKRGKEKRTCIYGLRVLVLGFQFMLFNNTCLLFSVWFFLWIFFVRCAPLCSVVLLLNCTSKVKRKLWIQNLLNMKQGCRFMQLLFVSVYSVALSLRWCCERSLVRAHTTRKVSMHVFHMHIAHGTRNTAHTITGIQQANMR